MKIQIPKHLKQNNILKTIDTLSFAKYITHKPLVKNSVQIDSNVLIYVTKGTKILHLSNRDITIKSGDILFLKGGEYLMSEVLDEYYEAFIFFYSDKLLSNFIDKYNIDLQSIEKKDKVFTINSTPQLQNIILTILPYFENNSIENKNIVILKFEEIFLNILNNNNNHKKFKNFLKLVYSDDEYFRTTLENRYEEFDTIKDMAEYFKISESNFRDKFKMVFDTTPKKWVLSKRLQKAKLLLEQSDLNVSEVCIKVGFYNISWFIQSFKKKFGITPKKQKLIKII